MRPVLLFLFGALVVAGAGLGVLGLEGRYARRDDPVTDNAYVDGNRTPLAAHLTGYVRRVAVEDNQPVRRGDLILEMVDDEYRAAVDQARARLAAAEATAAALGQQRAVVASQVEGAQATVAAIEAVLVHTANELARQVALRPTIVGVQRDLDTARADQQRNLAARAAALATVELKRAQADVLAAQVEQATAEVGVAAAALRAAEINLGYTRITAPIDGTIGTRLVREGSLLAPGTQVTSATTLPAVWVTANFTERQLTNIRLGQPAVVRIDAFPGVAVRGRVEGISPGTGGQFALVPADNTTGNFTKVVQRVPVRIGLDLAGTGLAGRIAPGMSAVVEVRTRT